MSKQILILSSSPRKGGNSDTLCAEFARGAEEAEHKVERVFLGEKKIGYCTACEACRGTGKCAKKDDAAAILDAMVAADVIVMASPVYFYSMCAQMKTLIDRTVARYTEISNKEFYLIATAAATSKGALERTIEGFRGFLDCLDGAKEKGAIYGTGAWGVGEIRSSRAMQQAYTMGRNA
jgi:multimeric flavodoxin WrbA